MSRWRFTTEVLAALLIVVGVFAAADYFVFPGSADWTPNIATDAFSIALTIVVIDRIVKREQRRRLQPRIDRALGALHSAFFTFVFATYSDYTTTHLAADPRSPPADFVELLEFWVREMDTGDRARPVQENGRSLFLDEGIEFVQNAQKVADADRDILESDLVAAIDSLDPIFTGDSLTDIAAEISARGSAGHGKDVWTVNVIVQSAAAFGKVFRKYVPSERSFRLWESRPESNQTQ